ncbi:hypothetical protein CEXT_763201 [Caerostris extrusa]|uniref:Uncharacterized protein n=1 Tax=Caerostris extrusa TaxID=172846 RepID=A0AAV4MTI0_CAEEX|nr:hypothetical protein CEXT_763201 [Caerostris extrusa]
MDMIHSGKSENLTSDKNICSTKSQTSESIMKLNSPRDLATVGEERKSAPKNSANMTIVIPLNVPTSVRILTNSSRRRRFLLHLLFSFLGYRLL